MSNIRVAESAGFCFGVKRAIEPTNSLPGSLSRNIFSNDTLRLLRH